MGPAPRDLSWPRRAVWPLLVMAALFVVSSVPGVPTPEDAEESAPIAGLFSRIPSIVHNALHVPGYALLGWTLFLAFIRGRSPRAGAAVALAILVATIYGGLLEIHQMQVPGRYASLGDVILNLAGATAGALLARRFMHRR